MALVVAIYAFVANRRLLWIVIPASVVIGFLLPETVIQRSQTGFVDDAFTGTAGLDSFMAGRNRMWLYTIENFYRDPLTLLFGSGRYTFIPLAYRQFGVMMPHNGYLEVLLDSGIVGFTVIIGFFAYVIGYFRRALAYGGRANRPLYFAALVGLSMFMLICLTGPTFYPAVSHVPVWLLIGLVGGVRQREFLKLGASQVGPAMEKIVLAVGPTITPRAQGRKIR